MRIAHLKNVAGFAWQLAEGQRALGHEATVFAWPDLDLSDQYGFRYDVALHGSGALRWNSQMLRLARTLSGYDRIHVHGGIWRGQVFYRALRAATDVPIAVHYHGFEARTGVGLHHQSVANRVFYTPADLKPLLPEKAVWVPLAVEIPQEVPEAREHKALNFVHFSSSEQNKGTARVMALFAEAFGEPEVHAYNRVTLHRTHEAWLWVYQRVPHAVVLGAIEQVADVVIDQATDYGIYGTVAAEAMARGRPVVASVNDGFYRGMIGPFSAVPIYPPTVGSLRDLAAYRETRTGLGTAGRTYARIVHDRAVVARRVTDAYRTFK